MFELLFLPLLGGLTVALIAGPLGAFTIWRGMAYFGDTLAHSALLGVGFALVFGVHVQLGILLCCVLISLVLLALQNRSSIAIDGLLGILSHSSLALGLIAISLAPGNTVDLFAYLFGDLLTININDILLIACICLCSLGLISYFWRSLLLISIDEELARAEGKNVNALKCLLMLLMAVVIAVAMKTVGILLITALFIIPAAAAQRIARSPELMAAFASGIASVSVIGGLLMSALVDSPTGPSIVICAAFFFAITLAFSKHH